jgi:hypothetical protein
MKIDYTTLMQDYDTIFLPSIDRHIFAHNKDISGAKDLLLVKPQDFDEVMAQQYPFQTKPAPYTIVCSKFTIAVCKRLSADDKEHIWINYKIDIDLALKEAKANHSLTHKKAK